MQMQVTLRQVNKRITDHILTGKACRVERERRRLSLRWVADKMELAPQYLSLLERGRANWSQDLIDQFNDAMDGKKPTKKMPITKLVKTKTEEPQPKSVPAQLPVSSPRVPVMRK